MTLRNVGLVAHPPFDIRPCRGKTALGRFDVAAREGGATLVKWFRSVSGIRKIFRRISQNLFRCGIISLQHGQVQASQSHRSIRGNVGGNILQNFSAGSGIAVTKHFEVGKADLGTHEIRRDLQRAIVTGSSSRPVTHEKVIISGIENDAAVTRIEGHGAFEACNRFAPTSLPAIDASNVTVDLGVIGRTRRGDLELLKSCVVLLIPQIEARGKDLKPYALRPSLAISVELPPLGRALSPYAPDDRWSSPWKSRCS